MRLTGFAGLPTLATRDRAPPDPVRQRPAGARPAAARRGARRLQRLPGARPPSDGGAVPRARRRSWSTSTSIRPRRRCASATPALVRGLIVGALRHALPAAGHRAATTVAGAALGGFRPGERPPLAARCRSTRPAAPGVGRAAARCRRQCRPAACAEGRAGFGGPASAAAGAPDEALERAYPLGAARAQLHDTYIVAQTADGIVIVDQHAAHERLVYERMKQALRAGGVARQGLLLPEVVELDEAAVARLRRARARSSPSSASCSSRSAPAPWSCARCRRCSASADVGRPGARPRRRPRRDRRCAGAAGAARARSAHDGLPRQRARRPPPQPRGDERAAARRWRRRPTPASATTAARPTSS